MIDITVLEKVLGGMSDRQLNPMKMILSWHPTEPMETGPFRLHVTVQMTVLRLLVVSSHLQLMGTKIEAEPPTRIQRTLAHL